MRQILSKITTLTAALILSSSALAAKDLKGEIECPPPPKLLRGWYIGGQLGYDSYRSRNGVNAPGTSSIQVNPYISATGWVGGLLLGYGSMYNEWLYVAGEIFLNGGNASQGFNYTNASTYTNRFLVRSSMGAGFLPGVYFTDSTLTYARLGWNRVILNTEETVTGTINANQSNDSNGFVFGFGIETLLHDRWSLRGEFDHTYYNSYNTTQPYGTKVHATDSQFMLALIYHFYMFNDYTVPDLT